MGGRALLLLLLVVVLWGSRGGSAQEVVLYNQLTPASGSGYASSMYAPGNGNDARTIWDDFTVPAGEVWSVTRVSVRGFLSSQNSSVVPPYIDVEIFGNAFVSFPPLLFVFFCTSSHR